jgi:hypothetical protein
MKTVISASRRTDLIAFFPGWLAAALEARSVRAMGPRGRVRVIDLRPESVHTIVLWSKNFANLLRNEAGLRDLLGAYGQLYLHFTVTGLGRTGIEPGAPGTDEALGQLPALAALAGDPRRVSLRFDPILFWKEGRFVRSNIGLFERAVRAAAACGVRDIRMSFAQWYRKARNRAAARDFEFIDPPDEEKRVRVSELADTARSLGLNLFACCQPFLAGADGIRPSACIDGRQLEELHPGREPASRRKDGSQRAGCLCTESLDIGSYTQSCPHGCLYCYANPAT